MTLYEKNNRYVFSTKLEDFLFGVWNLFLISIWALGIPIIMFCGHPLGYSLGIYTSPIPHWSVYQTIEIVGWSLIYSLFILGVGIGTSAIVKYYRERGD